MLFSTDKGSYFSRKYNFGLQNSKMIFTFVPLETGYALFCKQKPVFFNSGRIPEWPNGADCKSAGVRLRWFESIFSHTRGSSSVDRALAFQAKGREFEPRLPL